MLQSEKRRCDLEIQMLKAQADGGEQRMRERATYEDQIKELQNIVLDQKDSNMKKELEISQLQSKVSSLELQVENLKKERDRLLEVSKNLKISINKLEKEKTLDSIKLDGLGATLGNNVIKSMTRSEMIDEIQP